MLKCLAILAVLVILTPATASLLECQTAPLGPQRQGITKTSGGQGGSNQPQDGKKTTSNAVAATSQPAAPACDEACQQGRQNLAIQGRLEWFTGVLAIVGALQVVTMIWQAILLRQTRGDVHAQAHTMEEQAKDATESSAKASLIAQGTLEALTKQAAVMEFQAGQMVNQTISIQSSVTAAQTSADAANAQIRMVKDKERARISLMPLDLNSLDVGLMGANRVWFQIENFGDSQALNVTARCAVFPVINGIEPMNREINDLLVPTAIRANFEPLKAVTIFSFGDGEIARLNPDAPELAILAVGCIEYEDVFGEDHIMSFQYSLRITRLGKIDYGSNAIAIEAPLDGRRLVPRRTTTQPSRHTAIIALIQIRTPSLGSFIQ